MALAPQPPGVPFETDRAAAWIGWSYLILSVFEGRTMGVRSWRLDPRTRRFHAERLLA